GIRPARVPGRRVLGQHRGRGRGTGGEPRGGSGGARCPRGDPGGAAGAHVGDRVGEGLTVRGAVVGVLGHGVGEGPPHRRRDRVGQRGRRVPHVHHRDGHRRRSEERRVGKEGRVVYRTHEL